MNPDKLLDKYNKSVDVIMSYKENRDDALYKEEEATFTGSNVKGLVNKVDNEFNKAIRFVYQSDLADDINEIASEDNFYIENNTDSEEINKLASNELDAINSVTSGDLQELADTSLSDNSHKNIFMSYFNARKKYLQYDDADKHELVNAEKDYNQMISKDIEALLLHKEGVFERDISNLNSKEMSL